LNILNKKVHSNVKNETDDGVGSIEDHSAYFDSVMIGGQQPALKRTMRDFVGGLINCLPKIGFKVIGWLRMRLNYQNSSNYGYNTTFSWFQQLHDYLSTHNMNKLAFRLPKPHTLVGVFSKTKQGIEGGLALGLAHGFVSSPESLPPFPLPGNYPDDIERIINDILKGGGLDVLYWWLLLLIWSLYWVRLIKKALSIEVDIRFKRVTIGVNSPQNPLGQVFGWAIYDINDPSGFWLSILYSDSNTYTKTISINGISTTCLVWSDSLSAYRRGPHQQYFHNQWWRGLTRPPYQLSIPRPNSAVWAVMTSVGFTFTSYSHPLRTSIFFQGGFHLGVTIYGWLYEADPVAID